MAIAPECARAFGWDILPTVDFRAAPGAMVEDEVIQTIWQELVAPSAQVGCHVFRPARGDGSPYQHIQRLIFPLNP